MRKIYAVKTPECYYVALIPFGYYYGSDQSFFESLLYDGVPARRSFDKQWGIIDKEPTRISHLDKQPNVNERYVLINESIASESIPKVIPKEDIEKDDDYNWAGKYTGMGALYKYASDPQDPIEVDEEFEFIVLLEASSISEPVKMDYTVWKTKWEHEGDASITEKDVEHQFVDKLIFPSFLLHETPAQFTSQQMYRIIRRHVKDNIDPKVATITSDYDFCFTVKKRAPLGKPYHYQVDVNNNIFSTRKRKPKIETRLAKQTELPCFEMTWSPENYRGYTPINAFEARNEAELKEMVDTYLAELMAVINEPLAQCPNCLGVGYLKEPK